MNTIFVFFKKYDSIMHQLFNATVFLKALAWILELLTTFFLLLLPLNFLNHRLPELIVEWSSPWIFTNITSYLHTFLVSVRPDTQFFIIAYIGIYGISNICLAAALVSNSKTAYKVSIYLLIAFVFYMIFRLFQTHSLVLFVFLLWDIFCIFLVWYEYQKFLQNYTGRSFFRKWLWKE